MKIQQNEDLTNLNILKEFAEYKEYKILITSYNQIIKLNAKTPKLCESKFNHSDNQIADEYCADCDEICFMCKSCSNQHDKLLKNHKIKIQTNGIKISKFCQQNGCETKGVIKY